MIRTRLVPFVVCLIVVSLSASTAFAQDGEPAKDHPGIPRFPGFAMDSGREVDFDAFDFQISGDGAMKTVEGKSWDYSYNLKEGARHASPLEIFRNYSTQFTSRGGKVVWQQRDGSEGSMMMPLGAGERWLHLTINNDGENVMMRIIETAALKQKVEFGADEMAAAIESTGRIALHGILFDTGRTAIKADSNALVDEVAGMMKKNGDMKFRIEGHTDNVGAKAANLTLSRGRADAVKAALVSRGVAADRLTAEGLGDTKPVADNSTDAGRTQNRRVELVKQ